MLELEAYVRIRGPQGSWRDDYRAALVAWAVVASHSRRPRRHRIDQFIPSWGGDRFRDPDWDDDDPDAPDGPDEDLDDE